jgi:hypothetical protein
MSTGKNSALFLLFDAAIVFADFTSASFLGQQKHQFY